jgi:hypothetical protein
MRPAFVPPFKVSALRYRRKVSASRDSRMLVRGSAAHDPRARCESAFSESCLYSCASDRK